MALIAAFIPDLFFDHTGTFLAFLGVIFAPVVGIQIVDYFFLRKGALNIHGLFDDAPIPLTTLPADSTRLPLPR